MTYVRLAYNSAGVFYSQSFRTFSIKGLLAPDETQLEGFQHKDLSGVVQSQMWGFKRIINIDFGPISDFTSQKFFLSFIQSDVRIVTANNLSAYVALLNPKEFANNWINGSYFGKRFVLQVVDETTFRLFPSATPGADNMWLKKKVEITGTLASPQSLVTGSGALGATDSAGNPWPVFDDSLFVYHVDIDGATYCEAKMHHTADPAVIAGNMQLMVAHSDYGQAASDGKFYADVAIYYEAKP